jgi:pyruvate ferredoxin oxidoreductase delta subunit
VAKKFNEKAWHEYPLGFMVTEPGCAAEYRTGDWRSQRPETDKSKCIKCGVCYLVCPEGAIVLAADGSYDFDLEHCKGCGICATECPRGVVYMKDKD